MQKKGWKKINGVLMSPEEQKAHLAGKVDEHMEAHKAAIHAMDEHKAAKQTPPTPAPAAPLSELERVVDMALATKLVTGSRDEAILCAMRGQEAGVPILQALQGIYMRSFDDNPRKEFAFQAALIRGIVNKSGAGTLNPVTMTDEKVELEAVRFGVKGRPDARIVFVYNRDRATKECRVGNTYFQRFPAATMLSWLTSEASKMFNDVLGGATYTPEEFSAGPPTPPAQEKPAATPPAKAATKPTAAPKASSKATKGQDSPPPPPEAPAKAVEVQVEISEEVKPELPELTHEVVVHMKGVQQVMRTAGITLEQIQEVGRLCTSAGNVPGFEQRAKIMSGLLEQLGYPGIKYLSEERAEEMLRALRPNGAKAGKGGRTRAEILDALCAEHECSQYREISEKLILSMSGREKNLTYGSLDEVPERELQLAYDELAQLMAAGKAAFGIIAERAMMQAS